MPNHVFPAAAATALLAVSLSACGVSYAPANPAPASGSPVAATSAPSSASNPATSGQAGPSSLQATATGTAATPRSTSSTPSRLRSQYLGKVTNTVTCKRTPLELTGTSSVIRVSGHCDQIMVNAAGMVVLADDIGDLFVQGTTNVVIATSITTVQVSGAGNSVTWETGEPDVSVTGTGNVTMKEEQ